MPIILSQADRIAVSRRLVKIPVENAAYTTAKNNSDAAQLIYQQVDDANSDFSDFYLAIADNYDGEYTAITGDVKATFSDADIIDSAYQEDPNIFFPVSAPFNYFLIPMIGDEVNGVTTGLDQDSEGLSLDNPPSALSPSGNGILQIIDILTNGFNDAAGSETLDAGYTSGGTSIQTVGTLSTAAGEMLLVTGGGTACILVVNSVAGTTINVYPLTTFSGTIGAGGTVGKVFPAFSGADRRSLTASVGAYQDILDCLTTTGSNSLITKVTNWENSVVNQLTYLGDNEDDRATQISQIATATTNCNTAQTAINTWQALSNTGVGGKFDDTPLANLLSAANTKIAANTTRAAQITTAVGSVIDNGDGTYTFGTSEEDIYYRRYQWVDVRINRALGSLIRAINSGRGSTNLQALIDNGEFLYSEYSVIMTAAAFVNDADGTNKVELEDASIFARGDSAYVVCEVEDELPVTIQDVAGNILTLDIDIPIEYTSEELVRIYKIL